MRREGSSAMAMKDTMHAVEIDEELWFGSVGDETEVEERAAQSMAAVAARVLGAKPFPASARRLEELTRGVNGKIEQVVGVLESDPGLSMRLLRLVNSAGYALRVRCTSVRHAAALVGMRRLHQLATTAAVLDLFENDKPLVKSLLNHAAVVGAYCRYLAVHVDQSPDELFTCGFLHDIGKLMLIDAEGQTYIDLVRQAGDAPDTLHLLERERYGFDHAVLGAHVLKNWQIPNPVPRVVAWHHSMGRAYQADPQTAAMVQTLRLADRLSYLVTSNPGADGIKLAAETDSALYLGVSEAQLSAMWNDLIGLHERITALPGSGGQAELIPRQDSVAPSLRAKSLRAGASAGPKSLSPLSAPSTHSLSASLAAAVSGSVLPAGVRISEVPKTFVCVVCKKASHGTRCPICAGHVCSEHQVGPDQWCSDCATVYKDDVRARRTPNWVPFAALGTVVGSGLLSVLVAFLAGTPVLPALIGSMLLSSVAIVAMLIVRTVWLKRNFMRKRGHVVESEESPPELALGISMPQEPAIAMLSEPSLGAPTDAPAVVAQAAADSVPPPNPVAAPRWRRSELPQVVSVPPPSEPARARRRNEKSRRSNSSIPPVVSRAPAPAYTAAEDAPEWRPVERTEPARSLPTIGVPSPSSESHAPSEARPTPAVPVGPPVPAPLDAVPATTRGVEAQAAEMRVESHAVELKTRRTDPVPAAAISRIERAADPGASSTAVDPLDSEQAIASSPARAILSASLRPNADARAEAAATCLPPVAGKLVACRPASLKPPTNACSAPTR